VALLAEQPGIGAKYKGSRTVGVRGLFLSRVGHFIYYKAESSFPSCACVFARKPRTPAIPII